jgi:hypothetical protein
MTENTDKAWEKYGEIDPYFVIVQRKCNSY